MKKFSKLFLIATMIALIVCGVGCDDNFTEIFGGSSSLEFGESSSTVPIQEYAVTFDYNDGSGQKKVVSIPEGELINNYAPYPTSGYKEVVGWSALQQGSQYSAPITGEITLYAQWQTFEPAVYTSSIPDTISDKYVTINPSGSSLSNKTLRIMSSVNSIEIVSNGSTYENCCLMIVERMKDLNVTLNNLAFGSQNGGIVTDSLDSNFSVNLTVINTVSIDCSKYYSTTENKGADGIRVPNLNIGGTGTLKIYGGHGKNGTNMPMAGDGQHGQNGGAGTNGGSCIIANNVKVSNTTIIAKGGNGGNGGAGGEGNNSSGLDLFGNKDGKYKNGGNGGKGGNGGDALIVTNFSADLASLSLTGGNGGKGGAGGVSGGSSDTYAGYGGDGGSGGTGGSIFNLKIMQYEQKSTICNYSVGNGGSGGAGGYSAHNSKHGSSGRNGSAGKINVQQ